MYIYTYIHRNTNNLTVYIYIYTYTQRDVTRICLDEVACPVVAVKLRAFKGCNCRYMGFLWISLKHTMIIYDQWKFHGSQNGSTLVPYVWPYFGGTSPEI